MCGIIGAFSSRGAHLLEEIYLGLYALQHRGQEAAGVVAFWGAATDSPELKAIHERSMTAWRKRIAAWFIEAQDAGEFAQSQDPHLAADALVTFMLGAQVVLTMEPQNALSDMLTAQLEMLLDGFARDSDLTRDIAPVTA